MTWLPLLLWEIIPQVYSIVGKEEGFQKEGVGVLWVIWELVPEVDVPRGGGGNSRGGG